MAARGLVNGEGPTKWEGFSFPLLWPGDHCQSEKRQCQILHKSLRQTNILQTNRLFKQGRDLFIPEASDPAADVRYIEE